MIFNILKIDVDEVSAQDALKRNKFRYNYHQ